MIFFGVLDNNFFTKHEKNLHAKHLEESPSKGGLEASALLASPKHTADQN